MKTSPRPARPAAASTPEDAPDVRARIWQAVHAIPPGRVSTYGAIATLAGLPGRARLVGRVLSQLPDDTRLPWHRVVNASGRISARAGADGSGEVLQAERLRAEGVLFASTRVDLARLGWPDGPRQR